MVNIKISPRSNQVTVQSGSRFHRSSKGEAKSLGFWTFIFNFQKLMTVQNPKDLASPFSSGTMRSSVEAGREVNSLS